MNAKVGKAWVRYALATGVAVLGILLLWQGRSTWRSGGEGSRASGVLDQVHRIELTDLWLPSPLLDQLRARPELLDELRTIESIQARLQSQGLENAWYVAFLRNYSTAGQVAESTLVKPLGTNGQDSVETLRAMFATAIGRPPERLGPMTFDQARVHSIPVSSLRKELSQVETRLREIQRLAVEEGAAGSPRPRKENLTPTAVRLPLPTAID